MQEEQLSDDGVGHLVIDRRPEEHDTIDEQLFKRAVDAGARVVMPVTDMFWGDRFGKLADPFGHHWGIATRKEDLTPQEVQKRQAEWEKKQKK